MEKFKKLKAYQTPDITNQKDQMSSPEVEPNSGAEFTEDEKNDPVLQKIFRAMTDIGNNPEKRKEFEELDEESNKIKNSLDKLRQDVKSAAARRAKHLGIRRELATSIVGTIFLQMEKEWSQLASYVGEITHGGQSLKLSELKKEMTSAVDQYVDGFKAVLSKSKEEAVKEKRLQDTERVRNYIINIIAEMKALDILKLLRNKLEDKCTPQETFILKAMDNRIKKAGCYNVVEDRISMPIWSSLSLEQMRGTANHEFTHFGVDNVIDYTTLYLLSQNKIGAEPDPENARKLTSRNHGLLDEIRLFDECLAFGTELNGKPQPLDSVPFKRYRFADHDSDFFKSRYEQVCQLFEDLSQEEIDGLIVQFGRYAQREAIRIISETGPEGPSYLEFHFLLATELTRLAHEKRLTKSKRT